MAIYEEIKRKIEFIEKSPFHKAIEDCQTIIARTLRKQTGKKISVSANKLIEIDLIYILLRHLSWHHASLLPEFAIDYLNSEHQIVRPTATTLVESCLDIFNPYVPRGQFTDPDECDRSFLNNLMLASILSSDETRLLSDTGLGYNFLTILKNATQLEEAHEQYNFAPEVLQKLGSILKEIQQTLHQDPDLIHVFHLRSTLQKSTAMEASELATPRLRRCMQILLAIGPFGAELKQLESRLQELYQDQPLSSDLDFLNKHHFLYWLEPQRPTANKQSLRLSKLGLTVICHPYIQDDFQKLATEQQVRLFARLPENMQEYYVESSHDNFDILNQLLQVHPERLSPKALQALVPAAMPKLNTKELVEVLAKVLQNSQNPWLRAAACEILTRFPEDLQGTNVLEQAIQSDVSPMVRRRARDVLRQCSQDLRMIQNE